MRLLKSYILTIGLLLSTSIGLSQQVTASVDTISVKVGESINYMIKVMSMDSTEVIKFPKQKKFGDWIVGDEGKVNRVTIHKMYEFIKEYKLINFKEGKQFIPRQEVLLKGSKKYMTDSIPVKVRSIEVDTISKKFFENKANITTDNSYLLSSMSWVALVITILLCISIVYYIWRFINKNKLPKRDNISVLERTLAILEENTPSNDGATNLDFNHKKFYTTITDVVRQYFNDELDIAAMESTSEELLIKINFFLGHHGYKIDTDIFDKFRLTLKNADLVKFAKSKPEEKVLKQDVSVIKNIILEISQATQKFIEQRRLDNIALDIQMRANQKKKNIYYISFGSLAVLLIMFIGFSIFFNNNLLDVLKSNDSKSMVKKTWVTSSYGYPSVTISTPEVLVRKAIDSIIGNDDRKFTSFEFNNLPQSILIKLNFTNLKGLYNEKTSENKEAQNQSDQIVFQKMSEMVDREIALLSGSNAFIKNDKYSLPQGGMGFYFYGDFDIKDDKSKIPMSFHQVSFFEGEKLINVLVVYKKDNSYSLIMKDRIFDSIKIENISK